MSIHCKLGGFVCGTILVFSGMAFAQRPRRQINAPIRKPSAQVQPTAGPATQTASAATTRAPQQTAPVTLELVPATPPHVTMTNGMLSINAENSMLGDVLNQVKAVTGASVEAPTSANAERVVLKLGPGKPQEVLQQLFTGSKFDYIILGSNENPASVQKIILTPRVSGNTALAANNRPGPGQPQNVYQPPPPEPDMSADNGVEDETVQPEPPPEEVSPPAAGAQQGQIGPGGQAAAAEQNQNGQQQQQQQGPKTPEQLLQELQRMQQQQQQQGDPNRQQRENPPQEQ
jgi:hypothetical protein